MEEEEEREKVNFFINIGDILVTFSLCGIHTCSCHLAWMGDVHICRISFLQPLSKN